MLPAELSVKQVSVPCLPGILQLTTLTRLNLLVVDVVFLDEDEDEGGYCWSSCYLVRAHTFLLFYSFMRAVLFIHAHHVACGQLIGHRDGPCWLRCWTDSRGGRLFPSRLGPPNLYARSKPSARSTGLGLRGSRSARPVGLGQRHPLPVKECVQTSWSSAVDWCVMLQVQYLGYLS